MTAYEQILHLARRASPARLRTILRALQALDDARSATPRRTDRELGEALRPVEEFEEWRDGAPNREAT